MTLLKTTVGLTCEISFDSIFRPLPDSTGEYGVEDLLNSSVHRSNHSSSTKYLFKGSGYSLAEFTWEPASNLLNYAEILSIF